MSDVYPELNLALVALLASQSALIGWIVKKTLVDARKDLREHTKASVELKDYLIQRNGRDAEQHKENIKVQKRLVKSVDALTKQTSHNHKEVKI